MNIQFRFVSHKWNVFQPVCKVRLHPDWVNSVYHCDDFDARGWLQWLVHLLITCRVDLHCFAWSFVSHFGIGSCVFSYQAIVVLRCEC